MTRDLKLLHNRDWPEYVEPIRPIYEEGEIQASSKRAMRNSVFLISAIFCRVSATKKCVS